MEASSSRTHKNAVDKKFLNLIQLTRFCGICVENTIDLQHVNTTSVVHLQKPINITLENMICEVFKDINVLLSQQICKICIDKIKNIFQFISTTKETRITLTSYVNYCFTKAEELHTNIDTQHDESKQSTNAFIRIADVENIPQWKQEYKSEEISLKAPEQQLLKVLRVTSGPVKGRKHEVNEGRVVSIPVKRRRPLIDSVHVIATPIKRIKLDSESVERKVKNIRRKKTKGLKNVKRSKIRSLDKISEQKKIHKRYKAHIKSKKNDTISIQQKPGSKKEFKCAPCKITLPTYRLWQAHKKDQHKTVPKCKICSKVYPTAGRLIVHYKQHNKLKCKICKLLITDTDLNEHLKINHENETHPCEDCGKLFYTDNALKVHVSVAHVPEPHPSDEVACADDDSDSELCYLKLCLLCQRNFKKDEFNSHKCKGRCPDCTEKICIHHKYLVSFSEQTSNKNSKVKCLDCDYVCVKKSALISHVNHAHLKHLPFICNDCDTKFTSKYTLQNHIYRCHMPECVCKFCDRFFTDVTTLKSHISACEVNPREYKCDSCPASFVNQAKLTIHGRLRHSLDYYACDNNNCKQKFLTEEALNRHKRASHGPAQHNIKNRPKWVCGKCDKKFDRKVECEIHRETHHDPNDKFHCSSCKKDFENLKGYRRHLHNHRRADEVGKRKYECGRCEQRFGTIEQCTVHRESHDPNDMYKCRKCNKEFETAEKFRAHTYRHSLQSKKECEVCGKLVINLAGHLDTHRVEGKNSICDKCGKRFATDQRLKAHQAVHNEVMVKCDVCKRMVKEARLSYHKDRHTKTMRWYVHCEYCNKRVTKKNYEGHVNGHHLFIRPYSCDKCNKKFHAENNLKVHLKLHKEVKMFTCGECNKFFLSRKGLERHGLLHTGERPFTCDICGRGFITITRMKDHRRKHFAKTVACPICSSMFFALNLMRSHFKKVHWKDKSKKYDPKELVSEEYYYLFEDGRKPPVKNSENGD